MHVVSNRVNTAIDICQVTLQQYHTQTSFACTAAAHSLSDLNHPLQQSPILLPSLPLPGPYSYFIIPYSIAGLL